MTKNGDVTSEATFDRDVNGDEAVIIRKTARFEALVLYEKRACISTHVSNSYRIGRQYAQLQQLHVHVFCTQNKP